MQVQKSVIEEEVILKDLSPNESMESLLPNEAAGGTKNSPVRAVADTVPVTDDPSLPCLTFRALFLGTIFAVLSATVAQIYFFRANTLSLSIFFVQLLSHVCGKALAATLPTSRYRFPFSKWHFTLNPGPFNIKEHVLITVAASTSGYSAYAIDVISVQKLFYKQDLGWFADILLLLTTQCIGYGMAGFFRRYLVQPAAMVWPSNLVQVALFLTLHEKQEERERETLLDKEAVPEGQPDVEYHGSKALYRLKTSWTVSRPKFFMVVFVCTLMWQFFPSFIIPLLSTMPLVCWMSPTNRVFQLFGSGMNGLGVGAISLDWSVIGTLGPLFTPWWAQVNQIIGLVASLWIVAPITYFSNLWNATNYPIVGAGIFDMEGNPYNISRVLTPDLVLNSTAYESYPLRMGTYFAVGYGYSFMALTATLTHVVLYYGKDILGTLSKGSGAFESDVHAEMMKNYEEVPLKWYTAIFVTCVLLAIFVCEAFPIYLPWWAVLLAVALAFVLTLPIGIIQAISNSQIGLNVITEFVIGYLLPGFPVANIVFKTYGYMAMSQCLSLVGDLKLGQYLKIPPKAMFIIQLYGTILGAVVNYIVMLWILATKDVLGNVNSQWQARNSKIFFSASMIWGAVGPARMFGPVSPYQPLLWCFFLGFLLPIPFWYLGKKYPESPFKFHLVNIPIIALSMGMVPQNPANFIIVGFFTAFVFQFYIYRYHHGWWKTYNYTLSAALDAGTAVCLIILTIIGSFYAGFEFPRWAGNNLADPEQCVSFTPGSKPL